MSGAQKHFDREEYLATLEPPVFTAGGQRFIGQVLSAEEWFPLEARLERAAAGELSRVELLALVRDLTQAMFPPDPKPTLRERWRYGPRPRRSVWDVVRRLPFNGQLEAIRSFSEAQARIQHGARLGDTETPTESPTTGSSSPG